MQRSAARNARKIPNRRSLRHMACGLISAAMCLLDTTANAQRQSGTQMTPDSARYLISKDVGNERWAISYDLDDDTVAGGTGEGGGGVAQSQARCLARSFSAIIPAQAGIWT